MPDSDIVASIRAKLRAEDYVVGVHCDDHAAVEDFRVRHGITVALSGTVIKEYSTRDRVLFCGKVRSLRLKGGFRGRWLHTVVEHREDRKELLVTMYRPKTEEWRSERRRRW